MGRRGRRVAGRRTNCGLTCAFERIVECHVKVREPTSGELTSDFDAVVVDVDVVLAPLLDHKSDGVDATEDQVEIELTPCGLCRVARERLQGRRRSSRVAKRFSKLMCFGKRCYGMAIDGKKKQKASTITNCWPLAVDGRFVVAIGQERAGLGILLSSSVAAARGRRLTTMALSTSGVMKTAM